MTFLEPLIRRLYLSGYTDFFIRDPEQLLRDSNIAAWIRGSCAEAGTPSADLTARGPNANQRRSYVFWGDPAIPGAPPAQRSRGLAPKIGRLAAEIVRAGGNTDAVLRLLIARSPTTVPNCAERGGPVQEPQFPYRIEALSLTLEDVIWDYLRMCQANIFNTSNNPVSSRIIADGIGVDERSVIRASDGLYEAGRLEAVTLGSRMFYRVPGQG
jgi:hypothetical protein